MSFKGIITKGEYDRGITLNAKVVAPNKKYSSKKDFPVVIKANALSDREKCLIALNDHKASILALGDDLNNLTYDIVDKFIEGDTFGYKTSSVYSISSPLDNYLSSSGAVTGFPKYGTEDAVGTIAITTSLNDVSMTTHIPVTIKALTALDVLNNEALNTSGLWEQIKGGNSSPNNIYKTLNLKSQITLSEISDTPITITWNITDTALSIFNAYSNPDLGYTNLNYNKRINVDGTMEMIPYPVAYGSKANLEAADIPVIINNNGDAAQIRSFSIGGIVLKATLSLEGSEETVIRTFNPKVRTELLTASEIFQVMNTSINKLFQFVVTGTENYNHTFPVNSVVSPNYISIDSSVDSTITFKVKANGETISVPQYGLPNIISLSHTELPKILVGNINPTSSSVEYGYTYPAIFSSITGDGNNNYMFTMNASSLKTLSETQSGSTKFTIELNYQTTGYPTVGTNTSESGGIGSSQTGSSFICFEVNFTNE